MSLSEKAVIYTRVSSREQEKEGFSIPAQEKLLRGYASEHGISVVREFKDVETAKRAGRTEFGNMITFLKRNQGCRIVLVEKTDRLYRNFKDYVTLDDLDLDIHLVKEGQILSKNSRSSEKFIHGIKVLMAKNYIDNLSEESRKGMVEKAGQGFWPSYAPLGYRNVSDAQSRKVITPDPEFSPLIKRLFALAAHGEYSIKELARILSAEGFTARSGSKLSTATVHKILRNRIYSGEFDWSGKVYEGIHEPLVSLEKWEHVQRVYDQRLANRSKKSKHQFLFSGLLKCGHCNAALVGEIKKGKYIYYHCTGSKGKCPEPYVREEVLASKISAVLRKLRLDDEIASWIVQMLRESQSEEKKHREQMIHQLESKYQRLQNRLDALYEDKLDQRIDTEFYDRKSYEWKKELTKLKKGIEKHQKYPASFLQEGIQILKLSQRAGQLFDQQSSFEQRRLLNCMMHSGIWKNKTLSIQLRQPFDLLLSSYPTSELHPNGTHSNFANHSIKRRNRRRDCKMEQWLPSLDSNQDSRRQRPLSYH